MKERRGGQRRKMNSTGSSVHRSDPDDWKGGSQLRLVDEVVIVVTRAFGPKGDNLVGLSDVSFDGFPAVTLKVRTAIGEGLVHLSPIHGDPRKEGYTAIEPGTKCELLCPVSEQLLDVIGEVNDGTGAVYHALYLTEQLSKGEMVSITDVWGHHHSRVVDDFELIAAWAAAQESNEAIG